MSDVMDGIKDLIGAANNELCYTHDDREPMTMRWSGEEACYTLEVYSDGRIVGYRDRYHVRKELFRARLVRDDKECTD